MPANSRPYFRIKFGPLSEQQLKMLNEVERLLAEINIGFDTNVDAHRPSDRTVPPGYRLWIWDWTLQGPIEKELLDLSQGSACWLTEFQQWGQLEKRAPLYASVGKLSAAGVGAALAAVGIVIAIAGFRQFQRAGTNVRPDRTTTALITGGIYRYSRNPLYIALALIYVGIAVAADSVWALALLVPTLVVIRYGVIAREEAYLERKFGDDYRGFKAAVRRWL